jgi:hypothetical protein
VRQVFRITRRRTARQRETGALETTTEVVCGIPSLSRQQAAAQTLLALNRARGGIEIRRHWVQGFRFLKTGALILSLLSRV